MSAEDVGTIHFRSSVRLSALALVPVFAAVFGGTGCGVEEHPNGTAAPINSANDLGPPMEARAASVLALRERLPAPCIADLAWGAPPPLESIASHCLAINF